MDPESVRDLLENPDELRALLQGDGPTVSPDTWDKVYHTTSNLTQVAASNSSLHQQHFSLCAIKSLNIAMFVRGKYNLICKNITCHYYHYCHRCVVAMFWIVFTDFFKDCAQGYLTFLKPRNKPR